MQRKSIAKRIVINKPKNIKCEICQKEVSLYALASHIKHIHKISSDEYALRYGEFRKPKRINGKSNRKINKIECQLCEPKKTFSSVGMFTHLRDSHNITPDEYCQRFGEYRPSKLRKIEYKERLRTSETCQTCVICNETFASGQILAGHIKSDHLISKREYIFNHFFQGSHPLCKCGCGKRVKILPYYPYKYEYRSGHNSGGENNGMYGKKHSPSAKKKMSEKAIIRINADIGKKIDTVPELKFKEFLDKNNIKYIHPHEMDLGYRKASIDFYLSQYNLPIEIDGLYWHPEKLENINFHILPNVISDGQKCNIPNLIRIKETDVDNIQSLDDLSKYNRQYKLLLEYNQCIIRKEYFKRCYEKRGRQYVEDRRKDLLKFLRTFQPEFPYPSNNEDIEGVTSKIQQYDLSKIYDPSTRYFSNGTSALGNAFLKSIFKSYWKSSFKENKSPVDAWRDDKIMQGVINYRIGLNNSGEIFDFSLHQIIRGLSAIRHTVSFFKPLLAAAIYTHYLGKNTSPIVFDPCCGFGGRLLGFKAKYPTGTYIGCEPNIETYNELLNLIFLFKWENVIIHNCKIEEFSDNIVPDLIFTSIPYYDLETYSCPTIYPSFNQWKESFIFKIMSLSKLGPTYINLSNDLAKILEWNNVDTWISSNRSHFDKSPGKKLEPIVKLSCGLA